MGQLQVSNREHTSFGVSGSVISVWCREEDTPVTWVKMGDKSSEGAQ